MKIISLWCIGLLETDEKKEKMYKRFKHNIYRKSKQLLNMWKYALISLTYKGNEIKLNWHNFPGIRLFKKW
jgi:hypothetical protein